MDSYPGIPEYLNVGRPKSNLYATRALACTSGWNDIKDQAFRGLLNTATVSYENDVCKLLDGADILGTLWINSDVFYRPPILSQNVHTISRPDGTSYVFTQQAGQWKTISGVPVDLKQVGNEWQFTDKDGNVDLYAADGRLVSSTSLSGLTTSYNYDVDGALVAVNGPFGQSLTLSYSAGRIANASTPLGSITYRYDNNNNLQFVDYPDGTTRQYHYEDTAHPNQLTGVTDARGIRYATWAYDMEGKAVMSEHAGGVERVNFGYNADGSTTVTTGSGASRTYRFAINKGVMDVISVSGDLCPACANGERKNRNYDVNGYLSAFIDWSDSITRFGDYDEKGQPGCRSVGIALIDGSDTRVNGCAFDPALSPEGRLTGFIYDSRFRNTPNRLTERSVFGP